jgi:thiol-disulfide isomerase/thioredoxin
MWKRFALASVLTSLVALASADEPKKPTAAKDKAPSLKVGDPAPPLKASKWLQGDEVKSFSPGKVYVIEFWATWCGPCIAMMPHMAQTQAHYREKGVTIIGYTAKDPNNPAEKVANFVTKRGPKLGYTFAYAEDRDTYNAWMTAAGQTGIPCSFVVDQQGKVAYIGHPLYLDEVLPRVVAGTWKGREDAELLVKVEQDLGKVFEVIRGKDGEAGLKGLKEFETKWPRLREIPYIVGPKLEMLVQSKHFDEAEKMADEVLTKAVKQEDPFMLRAVSSALILPAAKGEKRLAEKSIQAAQALVKISGDDDALAQLALGQAYFAAGDKEKARKAGQKAMDAAATGSAGLQKYIEAEVKKLDGSSNDNKPIPAEKIRPANDKDPKSER